VSGVNLERWSQLWHTATNAAPPSDTYARLVALYSEPHRCYHNLAHIEDCLGEFDRAKQLATDPAAVELAIWFHDAVYDPRAADNEERSAELAKDWLSDAQASDALTDSVGRLVLATKNHDASLHADAPLLVDVDLSILGKPPEQFWEYERQIRAEYAWVEKTVFVAKRVEILHRFLARQRIYQTELFFQRMEAQARANLRASVQRLSDGLSS
jgi:predicted metal-dependent HD superfamily phosphohydrolase